MAGFFAARPIVFAAAAAFAILSTGPAAAQPFPIAACGYFPDWPLFKAGVTQISHSTSHTGPANQPGTVDAYQILLPDVRQAVTRYSTVKLYPRDSMSVVACGCVQTGGSGKTWKRYVDPSGPNAGHLYRGMISYLDDAVSPPPGTWTTQNMMTVQNWMASGQVSVQIPPGHTASLLLGYQDDGYGDNGYWGHDDGTEGQCHNVGGAAVQVSIVHH